MCLQQVLCLVGEGMESAVGIAEGLEVVFACDRFEHLKRRCLSGTPV